LVEYSTTDQNIRGSILERTCLEFASPAAELYRTVSVPTFRLPIVRKSTHKAGLVRIALCVRIFTNGGIKGAEKAKMRDQIFEFGTSAIQTSIAFSYCSSVLNFETGPEGPELEG